MFNRDNTQVDKSQGLVYRAIHTPREMTRSNNGEVHSVKNKTDGHPTHNLTAASRLIVGCSLMREKQSESWRSLSERYLS